MTFEFATLRTRMSKATKKNQIFAGLDVGTTKVTCTIGVVGPEGLEVIGVGQTNNQGMRQGVVVNIEATIEAITKAREEAELMAGSTVESVWLAIGGSHVQSFDSSGMVAIRNKEVTSEDMARVIEAAKAIAIPNDRQVLHVLPKSFKIDDQEGINDPIGMSGVRLECSVHIITASNSAVQNAIKCTEKSGLKVDGLVLQSLASAMAVLSPDEKNLGVCLVDMGGGTCDMVTYSQGAVVHTAVVPVGGQNFTHDVAMGLRTTQVNAENLKRKYGCAIPDMVNESEAIEVESVGGRKARNLARRDLCQVLEARAEETLGLVRQELEAKYLITTLGSGVVLTGGASQLQGLVELGDFIFDLPVRRGLPDKVGGLTDVVRSASHSTGVGLLLYAMSRSKVIVPKAKTSMPEEEGYFSSWSRRLKELLG